MLHSIERYGIHRDRYFGRNHSTVQSLLFDCGSMNGMNI